MNKKIIFPLICAFLLAGCNSNNNSNNGSNNSNSQVVNIDDNLKSLLQGNLELNGSYTKTGTKHQLNVSFYNDTYALKDISDEGILLDKYVKKSDGIYKEVITKNNDLAYKLVDSDLTSWSKYENPFKNLTSLGISKYGLTRYNLSGNLQQILQIVSGWNYQVKSMYIETSPKPQLIIEVDGKLGGNITFTFDLVTATKEFDIKYAENENADTLAQAVEDIYKNYTITDVTHINGQDDTTKIYYRSENVFFSSYQDDETNNYGYVFKNDGIYSFNVENGLARNVTLFNDDSSKEINFRLDFDMSWDLFDYDVTNEIYVTKDKNVTSLLAESFAYDYDTYVEFLNYGTSIEVKLNGTSLDYYVVNGVRNGQAFSHKITISNIGSTSQPFDVSSIDNNREDLSKIKAVYFGTYKGTLVKGTLPNGVTDITLVISASKVTLNDKEAIVKSIKYYEDKYIHAEFVWEGMELFFTEYTHYGDAGKSLEVKNNDSTIISNKLTKQVNELEEIEGEYETDYFYSMNDDDRDDLYASLVISNNTAKLNVPDSKLDGLHNVTFNYVGKTSDDKYEFKNETYGSLFVEVSGELHLYYDLAYNEGTCATFELPNPIIKVEIPNFFVGTYVGSLSTGSINGNASLEIVITNQSVTINNSITTLISYDSASGIKISINNINFFIKSLDTLNPTNKISVISEDSSISGTEFTRKGTTTSDEIPNYLIATWKNEDTYFEGDDTSGIVTVKITATNLTINSEDKNDACLQNQVFDFVEVSTLDGKTCYVFNNETYNDIKVVDYGSYIVIDYETAGIYAGSSGEFFEVKNTPTGDLSSLVGTWTSTDSYDLNKNPLDFVRVVISSDGTVVLSSSSNEAYLNKTLTFVKFDDSNVAYFVDGEGNQMTIDGVSIPGSLSVTYLAGGLTGEEIFK